MSLCRLKGQSSFYCKCGGYKAVDRSMEDGASMGQGWSTPADEGFGRGTQQVYGILDLNLFNDIKAKKKFPIYGHIMESNNEGELDVIISNVVATFTTGCRLDLHTIGSKGKNVIYKPKQGTVTMQLRKPRITANIWASGKVICIGASSEADAKLGARRIARCLQKLGFGVTFGTFKVVNVMATCSMPFKISLVDFTMMNRFRATYEPELHPAALYTMKEPKATIKAYATGSVTILAPSMGNVAAAVQHVYPLLSECRRPL